MIGSDIIEGTMSAMGRMVGRNVVRWFVKITGFLGVSFVSYDTVVNPIMSYVTGAWNGLPSNIAHWLGAMGIDVAVTIILSAYTISFLTGIGLKKT